MFTVETCAYCHLPISAKAVERRLSGTTRLFCCYGCFLLFQITTRRKQERSGKWFLTQIGIGTFLTMCVMLIGWVLEEFPAHPYEKEIILSAKWLIWALATSVLILIGYPLLKRCVLALASGSFLIEGCIGVVCAVLYGYSFANLCNGREPLYFDTVCATMLLVTLGKILEATSKSIAAQDIREFLGHEKAPAFRIDQDKIAHTTALHLEPGDLVRVPPGYTIPADGKVLEGCSRIRRTPLTGEREPVVCREGDEVLCGGKVIDETLTVQVIKTGKDTVLARLLSVVERSVLVPSNRRYLVDQALRLFRPLILVAAICALLWSWQESRIGAWVNLLSVLVIACPCALVLTTPMATTLAVARAAREGILISEAAAIEKISNVNVCIFDETEPAETGESHSYSDPDWSKRDIYTLTADGTGSSTALAEVCDVQTTTTTTATLSSRIIAICTQLQAKGLRTVLLTGPSFFTGKEKIYPPAIDGFYTGISSQEKAELLRSYREQGYVTACVSEYPSAPVWASDADIRFTIGANYKEDLLTNPVTFLGTDLERLPWLIDLSHRVLRTVNWNLAWSSFYSIVGMFAAAAGMVAPVLAAGIMLLGGSLVAGNTAQLHNYPGPSESHPYTGR